MLLSKTLPAPLVPERPKQRCNKAALAGISLAGTVSENFAHLSATAGSGTATCEIKSAAYYERNERLIVGIFGRSAQLAREHIAVFR